MFNVKQVRSFVIVALFISFINCIWAADRTEHKRLMQFSNTSSSSMFGSGSGYNHYGYRVDNESLIDTVGFYIDSPVEGVSSGTYQYYGSVQNTNEGKKYEYYVNLIGQSYPYKHFFYVLDAQNRVIKNLIESWSIADNDYVNSQDIYRHYNTAGYADSIYYSYPSGTHIYSYYSKRSFDGSRLQNTVIYSNGTGSWTPYIRYSYTYSENPVELPAFIRFDNLSSQSMDFGSRDFELYCNPKIIPDSIIKENWDGSAWTVDNNITVSEGLGNNNVSINYSFSGNNSNSSRWYSANMEGDIIEYRSSWSGGEEGGSFHSTYNWDSVVANEDNLAPEVTNSISAYPNPFNKKLTIALNCKDQSPVDITIYNIKGQLIRQWQNTKSAELVWNGKDSANQPVASGLYIIKSRQGKLSSTAKVIKL